MLQPAGLKRIAKVLNAHHSRDPLLICRIRAAMASMVPPEKESWKCFHCRKINKFSANYCPKCSRPWQEVIDRSYVDPRNVPPQGSRPKSPRRQGYAYSTEQEYEEPWHYQPWPRSPRKRTQSPRQRAPRAQSQGRGGKGKGQSSGKGQSAYYQDAGPNQFPSAPAVPKASSWMQMVPSPAAATATPPPPPPAGPALDPVKMKELFNLLDKRQDQLTPEIQAKMQEMKVDEVKVERAHMHHAVDHHGDAKQSWQQRTKLEETFTRLGLPFSVLPCNNGRSLQISLLRRRNWQ